MRSSSTARPATPSCRRSRSSPPSPGCSGGSSRGPCVSWCGRPASGSSWTWARDSPLLASSPEGACAYVDADVRDPERILAEAATTLDLSRPVALTMLGIMGQMSEADRPAELVSALLSALPPGSYLALSDGTDTDEALTRAVEAYNQQSAHTYHLRSPEDIAFWFAGLDLVEPGVVATASWRPDPGDDVAGAPDVSVAGVAKKA